MVIDWLLQGIEQSGVGLDLTGSAEWYQQIISMAGMVLWTE